MSRTMWLTVSVVIVVVVCAVPFVMRWRSHPGYSPPPISFSGDSSAAVQTVIVPSLDTPMPKGKNVIWCGTIQLCWDGLKALPRLTLPNDTAVYKRMNAATMSPSDLPPNEYYAAAGWLADGIVAKIHNDMAAKFPQVKVDTGPDLHDPKTESRLDTRISGRRSNSPPPTPTATRATISRIPPAGKPA